MENNKQQTAVDSIIEFCQKQMDNDSSIHKGVYLSIIKFCKEQITEESEIHWKTTLIMMTNNKQTMANDSIHNSEQGVQDGLTKREYFAAKAMQGLLSSPEWMKEYKGEKYLMQPDIIAEVAIKITDELIKALNKNDKQ